MIEKIASHLGDFTPRLQSNTRALYQVRDSPFYYMDKNVLPGTKTLVELI